MQRRIEVRRLLFGGDYRAVCGERHRKRHHGKIAVILRCRPKEGVIHKPNAVLIRLPVRAQIDPRGDFPDGKAVYGDGSSAFVAFDDRVFAEQFGVVGRRFAFLRKSGGKQRNGQNQNQQQG